MIRRNGRKGFIYPGFRSWLQAIWLRDAAIHHGDDAVDLADQPVMMGNREYGRAALARYLPQQVHHGERPIGIKGGRRLVGQNDLRIAIQSRIPGQISRPTAGSSS
jgi:hypothetical protein